MTWIPLHLHTHYSLLDGLSKPPQVADRCVELGYDSCAMTDHGTISGAVSFVRSMREKNVKPILGCEFYISKDAKLRTKENKTLTHLVVLAKNLTGWNKLIEATSRSNEEDVFYFKPRLDLRLLSEIIGEDKGSLISFSGHPGSDLANGLFQDVKKAYSAHSYDEAAKYLKKDWKRECVFAANSHLKVFGSGNFFIEIQLIDKDNFPASELIAECLRKVAAETKIPCVATADSHYPKKEDAADQRILLCSAMKTTLKKVENKIRNNEDVGMSCFFRSNNYHIPSSEEMESLHTEEEIRNSSIIASFCENYDILGQPMLPKFSCPNNMTEEEYLRDLCRDGWRKRLKAQDKVNTEEDTQKYVDRIKEELDVIQKANLSGYFLIVRDIINYVKENNWLAGPGRGSAAGCLISYLIGITEVDPIEYDLIFERFYNIGRNTEDHVSLPDIDMDVPATKRDEVIDYIRSKYGEDRVCQMVTFGRLQGRSALKEVLRVHDACSFDEMNTITKALPQEDKISDQLESMESPSSIMWTLAYQPEILKGYCELKEDGTLGGNYSKLFEQAIRLEGTYKSQGKHAAGVVISSKDLDKSCPMVKETNGTGKIAGLEMTDLEAMGHVKFDVLGVNLLDKLMGVRDQLLTGDIHEGTL